MSLISASMPKLSICINTFNRAPYISETLRSILSQATENCEVVVFDAASTDATETVVSEYAHRYPQLRYVRDEFNIGIDRGYNRAVELARGDYCWLMTDDDLLKPAAIESVLAALQPNVSLVIVNAETRDIAMSTVLQHSWLHIESDQVYGPTELDRLFYDMRAVIRFIGSFVINRNVWLTRDKERYYGSLYAYVGVIFQAPLPADTMVLSQPLVSYRRGNAHTYANDVAELLFVKWPTLVEGLALLESTKRKVPSAQPWRHPQLLLRLRALGYYSVIEYRRFVRRHLHSVSEAIIPMVVALIPGTIINTVFLLYLFARQQEGALQRMKESRHYLWNRQASNRDN